MSLRCPTCGKIIKLKDGKVSAEKSFLPFCSQRCKLIDLGAWLDSDYVIKTPLNADHKHQNTDK